MFSQLFGNYLVGKNFISEQELADIVQKQSEEKLKLGTIAVARGKLSEEQAKEINHLQFQMDKRFGDIAVEQGYLTVSEVEELLAEQGSEYMKFLQILAEKKQISVELCNEKLVEFQKYWGFSDREMSALQENDIENFVPAFVYASKPYVTELASLVIRNLIRFVTDDFYIGKIKHVNECSYKSMVTQKLAGGHEIMLGFIGEQDNQGMVALASDFVKIPMEEQSPDTYDAVSEFVNICNGLFATDLSVRNVDLDMEPPLIYMNQEIDGDGYVIPLYIHGKELKIFIAVDNSVQGGQEPFVRTSVPEEGNVEIKSGKGTVLIVDDSALIRKILSHIVENMGYVVVAEASNGAEGVEAYEKYHPDVITLDITMPVMDGLEALSKIMQSDKKAKAIIITAAGQQSKVIQALKLGAERFLMKPFNPEEVKKALEELIG